MEIHILCDKACHSLYYIRYFVCHIKNLCNCIEIINKIVLAKQLFYYNLCTLQYNEN